MKKIKKARPTYRIGELLKAKFSKELINSGDTDISTIFKQVKVKAAHEIGVAPSTLNQHIKLNAGSGYDIPEVTKKAYAAYFGVQVAELYNNKKVKAA